MGLAFAADGILSSHTLKKRLPAAALVLILHIGILSVLQIQRVVPADIPRETIITLPLLPKKKETVAAPEAKASAPQKSYGSFKPPAEPPQATPDLSALSFLLSKCSVNAIGTLTWEDRSRCNLISSIDFSKVREDFSGVSKAKHADQYAAEVKAKNTPFRVPCTYTMVPQGASSPAVMVDPICAAITIPDVIDRIRRGDY